HGRAVRDPKRGEAADGQSAGPGVAAVGSFTAGPTEGLILVDSDVRDGRCRATVNPDSAAHRVAPRTALATCAPDRGGVVERAVGQRQGATARSLEAAAKANAPRAAGAPGAADGLVVAEAAAGDGDGASKALNAPAHPGGDPRIGQARGPRPADRLVV